MATWQETFRNMTTGHPEKQYVGEIIQRIDAGGTEIMREAGYFMYGLGESLCDKYSRVDYSSIFRDTKKHKHFKILKKVFRNRGDVHPIGPDFKIRDCSCGKEPTLVLLWLYPKETIMIVEGDGKNGIHWPGLVCLDCGVIVSGTDMRPKGDDGWQWARPCGGHPIRGEFKEVKEEMFQSNPRRKIHALENNSD